MTKIKIQTEGSKQIIILPENYHIKGEEVYLKKIGDSIILLPIENPYQSLLSSLELFSDDFMDNRQQLPIEERDNLFI